MRKAIDKAGYTLVELMIVVAIVGVLAMVGYVGVRRYIASSKSAEARNAVGMIAKDAVASFERDRNGSNTPVFAGQVSAVTKALCASATATVPATYALVKGKKYQSAPSDWSTDAASRAGFSCLGFTMDQPQYYMYSYARGGTGTAIGDTFTGMARGDINGVGATSQFSMTGTIGSGYVLLVSPGVATTCTGTCSDL